jgi:hypothetical protein
VQPVQVQPVQRRLEPRAWRLREPVQLVSPERHLARALPRGGSRSKC